MPENIIQIDQNLLETRLDRLITEKMTQILNAMLDAEADEITGAARYERSGGRKAYRAGHYERKLTAKAGRLRAEGAETQGRPVRVRGDRTLPAARAERRGIPDRHVPGGREHPPGRRHQPIAVGRPHALADIERQAQKDLRGDRPVAHEAVGIRIPVRVRGRRVAQALMGRARGERERPVAIGINAEGHREVIGVTEGMREDSASWEQFFRGVIERGLKGVRLVVGDRCAGLVATVGSMLPKAKYQRCMVHFMRNVLSKVPPIHREWASAALKAVFAMESRESALDKAEQVAAEMRSRRLRAAANCLREGVGETTTYLLDEFPDGHRRRIRTNNMIERLNREIRRRTRVVGGFPDGNSALMLVCARIRYVTANEWSTRRYLDMSRFDDNLVEAN